MQGSGIAREWQCRGVVAQEIHPPRRRAHCIHYLYGDVKRAPRRQSGATRGRDKGQVDSRTARGLLLRLRQCGEKVQ